MPDLLALAHDEAVEELDLGAPALLHVLAHRGALLGRHLAASLKRCSSQTCLAASSPSPARAMVSGGSAGSPPAGSPAPGRRGSPRCRAGSRSGGSARSAASAPPGSPVQAERPLPMTLATSLDQRSPQRLSVTLALSAVPTSRQTSSARGVTRPCTSPARNTVCAAPRLPAPRWMWPGSGRLTSDGAGDAAERLAPADDAGDRLLVHAVLQRDHEAVGRQILPDHHGRPGRVVGLGADEGDVDGLLLGELLHLREVQRAHRDRELRHVLGVGDAQPVLLHVLDVLGPGVDERHVLARLHHVRARIAADRARPDDRNLAAHALLRRQGRPLPLTSLDPFRASRGSAPRAQT